MKTELYKMLIDFCKDEDMRMSGEVLLENGEKTGEICFRYDGLASKVKNPSPEYDAWRTFMAMRGNAKKIIEFIASKFDIFKDMFPTVCVTLDLHQIELSTVIDDNCNLSDSIKDSIKRAVTTDAVNIDNRKNMRRQADV